MFPKESFTDDYFYQAHEFVRQNQLISLIQIRLKQITCKAIQKKNSIQVSRCFFSDCLCFHFPFFSFNNQQLRKKLNLVLKYNFCQGLRYEQTFEISLAWAEGGRRRRSPMLKKGKYFEEVALRPRQRNWKSFVHIEVLGKN